MAAAYRKRMYNFKLFFGDIGYMIANGVGVLDTIFSKRIPRQTVEKIMLATTAVNECAHCSRLHSTLALMNGVDQAEIDEILAFDINSSVNADERVALAFAQHYAEHDRSPDEKALAALFEEYGEKKAQDVIHYIRFIYIGNLIGNTVDGFFSRFKGVKPDNGYLAFELFMLLLCSTVFLPFVIPAAIWIFVKKRRLRIKERQSV